MKHLFLQSVQTRHTLATVDWRTRAQHCRECFLLWPVVLLAVDLLAPEGTLGCVVSGNALSWRHTGVCVSECTDTGA